MPIVKSITLSNQIQVSVWKIEEGLTFFNNTALNLKDQIKLKNIKTENHQKGFLASRTLLKHHNISPELLDFLDTGKPVLTDGRSISLSHSFDYACLITGEIPVGIDIEKVRPKILKVAPRFCEPDIFDENLTNLTKMWCAKEALYKCYGVKGLSLKKDISVDFPFESTSSSKAVIPSKQVDKVFQIHFDEFENYHMAFTYPTN